MYRFLYGISILLLFLVASCATQSASYHYYQKQLQHEDISFHKTLRINEYLNAFSQDWIKVSEDQDIVVRVDPLVNQAPSDGAKEIYQIAIKTRQASQKEIMERVALSLVIDVSGSMVGEKIEDTKRSMINSINELNNGDIVSIVTFNNTAEVIASNQEIDNQTRQLLIDKVNRIESGGGTNIGAGLIQGYVEMSKFPPDLNKRLLLLTDGQSNVHTLSPKQISEEAGVQYLEGARISTIGLGHGVNENLLRQIAKNGQGHYYFAEDSTALTKIMREDLKTTVIPVVKNVSLSIKLESGHTFENLYGSNGSNIKGKTELNINTGELNVNDWRIYIAEINKGNGNNLNAFKVEGSFTTLDDLIKPVNFDKSEIEKRDLDINKYVLRNTILYGNALSLIESSKLYEQTRYQEALNILDTQINNNEVLISIDNSDMLVKEKSNLEKVRTIILNKSGSQVTNSEHEMSHDVITKQQQESGLIKQLILSGLKLAEKSLPGLWSTVANLLIVAIE